MRDCGLLLGIALLLSPVGIPAQQETSDRGSSLLRENRVVVHSPHFDVPLPLWGGLSCPAGPLHLYGFEGEREDVTPPLRIRTFLYNPTLTREYVFPVDGSGERALMPVRATVRLTSRIEVDGEQALPLGPPWAQVADGTGLVELEVPVGVYRIRVDHLGSGINEGIIRVRETKGDSIHAYLIPGAICNE